MPELAPAAVMSSQPAAAPAVRPRALFVTLSALTYVLSVGSAAALLYAAHRWAGVHPLLGHARAVVYAACGAATVGAAVTLPAFLHDTWLRWPAMAGLLPPLAVFVVASRLLSAPHEAELFDAIIHGDEPRVRRALAWGVSPEARRPWKTPGEPEANEGASALTTAARAGRVAVVRLLLDRGADPRRPDGFGDLPVHRAAGAGHVAVVECLVAAGADPAAPDGRGDAAIHWAAAMARPETIDRLADLGVNVNAPGYRGATPLHRVAITRDLPATTRLLRRGADPRARDDDGQTPVDAVRRALADREAHIRANGGPQAFPHWSPVPLRRMIKLLEDWENGAPPPQ